VPQIAPFDAQIFNRKVMYQYLTPAAQLQQAPDMPAGWDAHVITGLDPSRVFCLIGTNAADYGAVSQAVGPKSDGLVQIDNAYVRGANRTFVHRSHSGRYGEVNSEEGYQNLRRFLFGTRKATARLVNATLPPATSPNVLDVRQAEVRVSIRGLPVLLDDQVAAHYCHVWAAWETAIGQVTSVPDPIVPQPLSPDAPGGLSFTIPRPPAGRQLLGPRAAIHLEVELLG
jgi:hypothetical protein